MTDEQLLELIETKTPEELTLAEVEHIRRRLPESSLLRDALLTRLEMEQYLSDALGRVNVSIDEIMAKAGNLPALRTNPILPLLGWVLCAVLVGFVGLVLLLALIAPPEDSRQASELASRDAATAPGEESGDESAAAKTAPPVEGTLENTVVAETAIEPTNRPARVILEAEKFSRGNVVVESHHFGQGIGIIHTGDQHPSFVEYELDVPAAGKYQVELRYAAEDARPMLLSINGQVVKPQAGGERTGGWLPDKQTWHAEGTYDFGAGKNVLRLEVGGEMPHIDQLAIAAPGAPLPTGVVAAPPVATPAPAKPQDPWDELAAAEAQPRPSAVTLFKRLDPSMAPPREAELKQWLAEVNDQPHNLSSRDIGNGVVCGFIDGVWRLRAPWKSGIALRLSPVDCANLKIHFWRGKSGVTLQYYLHHKFTWAAYATTRKATEPLPTSFALAATDEERYWRTNAYDGATIELRVEDELLILSRGDVRVLSVPLGGLPGEVIFEGHSGFRQFTQVRTAPLPAEAELRPTAWQAARPAQSKWSGELCEGSDFKKLDDGRVELSAEKNKAPAWVAFALPHRDSVHELIVRVDDPTPGTGVFLGDADGPRCAIGFFREDRTGWTSMAPGNPADPRLTSNLDINGGVTTPYSLPSPWLRLVYGCGSLHCSTSVDGVHWGRPFDPIAIPQMPLTHLGLFCVAGEPARSIKLARATLREFDALAGLAPVELRRKALALPQAVGIGPWLEAVLEAQPADADTDDWLRACAVRTLAANAPAVIGAPLIERLVEDALHDRKAAAQQMRLLDDLVELYPTWDQPALAQRAAGWYERVAQNAYRHGQTLPFTLIGRAQRTAPIWSRQVYNFMPDGLIRLEILELAMASQWTELNDFYTQLRFWGYPPQPIYANLLEWADALAGRALPKGVVTHAPLLPAEWRHPLLVDLSKEGYNVLAEFQAALDGKAYRDACQIISTSAEHGMLGLLPDARDPELMVSLSGAVAAAMRDHAGLRITMSDHFGPLGRLRIRQAIQENDLDAIEAATVQFFGTEAAAEAHLWLGDRALSSGAFAHAMGQFRRALPAAGPALRTRVTSDQQLAAAMMGQSSGPGPTQPLDFGGTPLAAAEFQAIVDDMRLSRRSEVVAGPVVRDEAGGQTAPAPHGFEAAVRFRFEGGAGDAPQNVPGEFSQLGVDWAARQMALVVDGNRLFFSNRFQMAAYDLTSGLLQWRSELGGEQGAAHEWTLTPMRPLITPGRIFVRRLYRHGPVLACLESATGKVLWTSRIEPDKYVVSDPQWIQDELFALTMTRLDQEFSLALATFDPATGAVLTQRPLVRMREHWWQQRNCQLVVGEDSFIIACGGTVLCCDLLGQVNWVRRQVWVPPAVDRSWMAVSQTPPVVVGDRLFVIEPGVPAVVCLDPDSGRLEWRKILPGAQRIVTADNQRLVVEYEEGFVALDTAAGKTLWRHLADPRLDAYLAGGDGGLLYTATEQVRNENNWRPLLVWVDLKTGQKKGEWPLASLAHERPKLGPMFLHGTRLFAAFGRGDQDPNRDVLELVPKEGPLGVDLDNRLNLWANTADASLRAAVRRVLPGWTVIDERIDANTGFQAEWKLEKDILCTLAAGAGRPLALVRDVTVPDTPAPRLQMRVANDAPGKWKLDVRMRNQTLLEQTLAEPDPNAPWKDLEVDLKPFAGKKIRLIVRQFEEGGPQPYARWKWLKVLK